MSVYTKTGDKGETSLFGKKRIPKSDLVVEVLGEIDELNAHLGLLHSSRSSLVKKQALDIQADLMLLGAFFGGAPIKLNLDERTQEFEQFIDKIWKEMPELTNFILPGGSRHSAQLHVCRAICRRLERTIAQLFLAANYTKSDADVVRAYVNRLSDLLFALARYVNFNLGIKDSIWKN